MKPYNKTILKNGLRLITVPQKESLAVTMLVLVEAGSKYETKNLSGLSHFLEHMCFKGTTKRPKAIDIARELDGIGASYNAFTSQEWTGYYAKAQAHELDTIIDVVADLYLNPTFNDAEIEKEKGVIIEEINMYEDIPQKRVAELFNQLLYGDQPAGWDVGGDKAVIKKLTRNDFVKYRGEHYVPAATTVIVAGAFEQISIGKKITAAFRDMAEAKKEGKLKTIEQQKKPAVMAKFKDTDQSHLMIGCRAFDQYDKRRAALEVLADMLGGGMSSRLFQRVREELGAAYYVKADVDLLTDHGFFAVAAGVEHSKLEIVIKAILEELQKMATLLVSEHELETAKDHLSGNMVLGLETSDALAMYYGGQEITHEKIQTPEEYLREIKKVTREQIRNVAANLFKNDRLNCALIGPVKDGASLTSIVRFD